MIVNLPFEDAAKMWIALEPLFLSVTKHTLGCYEPIDILEDVRTGHQKLWVAWDDEKKEVDAVMTTCIIKHPRRTELRIPYIAGQRFRSWRKEFIAAMEKYAADEGATLIGGAFRKEWAAVWPGAKTNGVYVVKELS